MSQQTVERTLGKLLTREGATVTPSVIAPHAQWISRRRPHRGPPAESPGGGFLGTRVPLLFRSTQSQMAVLAPAEPGSCYEQRP
jgi:hypothetical protein